MSTMEAVEQSESWKGKTSKKSIISDYGRL